VVGFKQLGADVLGTDGDALTRTDRTEPHTRNQETEDKTGHPDGSQQRPENRAYSHRLSSCCCLFRRHCYLTPGRLQYPAGIAKPGPAPGVNGTQTTRKASTVQEQEDSALQETDDRGLEGFNLSDE
jgi:hypothetical protein